MNLREKNRPHLLAELGKASGKRQTNQNAAALYRAALLEIQHLALERDNAKDMLSEVLDAMATIGATITENVALLRNLEAGK